MDELFRQIVIKLRGMWHFRWLGLATAWIVGALGVMVIMLVPDKYEASARIFVNTASILKPLMSGLTVQPNDDQQIAMLSRLVISRPNVEKLVQMVGLDADVKTKDDYERLVDSVTRSLEIRGSGRDNIYTLTFRDVQPERAKRVIQLLSSMFIESGYGGKARDTDAAKKFIDEQIAIYEKKLQEAENRLKDFKLKSLGTTAGEGKDHFARMAETQSVLEKAQLELREAENQRDAFKRGLAAEDTAFGGSGSTASSMSSTAISEIEGRLDAMRRNLDMLLQKYTENHPDVIGAQRVIRELEEQRSQLLAARRRDGVTAPAASFGSGPRASEQLKVSLASAEASVASLRARVSEYSARYARLRAAASAMPQLEAEFAQLNRDYDVNKRNYESLVARRESASISGEMQSVSGVADFRLIDPPRASQRPVSPNRHLLFPLALLVSLVSGLAVAYIGREVRPAFYDGRSLSEITGLPVLGTVSLLLNPAQLASNRKSMWRFVGGAGALIGTYLAGFLVLALLSARAA